MSEQLKNDDESTSQNAEPDVFALIKKMRQQLDSLDKKIDILISQSREKSSREKYQSRSFPSPDRPYRLSHYSKSRSQSEGSGERSFRSSYRSENRPGEGARGFGGPKKDYDGNRETRSSEDRPFKKKFGDKKRNVAPRKDSPFYKRKNK
ncbi:MAG: hypothetical protein PHY73_01635 [Candidatus Omnitrophica bacterium]|nr:hypothetical protein [Candidatus Omnitrophota bacterium]